MAEKITNAGLIKEKKILEKELELLKRQLAERPAKKVTNKRVYADKPRMEMNGYAKQSLIDNLKDDLKVVMLFVDPDVRERKKYEFMAARDILKEGAESWTIHETGNRWILKSIALKEFVRERGNVFTPIPEKDFIDLEFVHKGHLRFMLNSKGQNIADDGLPPTVDIFMTVRIRRADLD